LANGKKGGKKGTAYLFTLFSRNT